MDGRRLSADKTGNNPEKTAKNSEKTAKNTVFTLIIAYILVKYKWNLKQKGTLFRCGKALEETLDLVL